MAIYRTADERNAPGEQETDTGGSILKAMRQVARAVGSIDQNLIDPETDKRFILNDAKRASLQHDFELTPVGRSKYSELIHSAPEKSSKSGLLCNTIESEVPSYVSEQLSNQEQAAREVFRALFGAARETAEGKIKPVEPEPVA